MYIFKIMPQFLHILVLCVMMVNGQDVTVSDSSGTMATTVSSVTGDTTPGVVATPSLPPSSPPPPKLMIFPNLNEWKSSFKDRVDKLR